MGVLLYKRGHWLDLAKGSSLLTAALHHCHLEKHELHI